MNGATRSALCVNTAILADKQTYKSVEAFVRQFPDIPKTVGSSRRAQTTADADLRP